MRDDMIEEYQLQPVVTRAPFIVLHSGISVTKEIKKRIKRYFERNGQTSTMNKVFGSKY